MIGRRILAFVIGFTLMWGVLGTWKAARGQDGRPDGFWYGSPATKSLTFSKNMQPMVTITADGSVVYGEGYTPDDVAKALWDAVGVERKARNCQ